MCLYTVFVLRSLANYATIKYMCSFKNSVQITPAYLNSLVEPTVFKILNLYLTNRTFLSRCIELQKSLVTQAQFISPQGYGNKRPLILWVKCCNRPLPQLTLKGHGSRYMAIYTLYMGFTTLINCIYHIYMC